MENLLINGLDDILLGVQKLNEKYQQVQNQNKELENKIEVLKVESEQLKQQNLKIQEELEARAGEIDTLLLESEELSKDKKSTDDQAGQKNINAGVQATLDSFIEDIDQCIQIIQAKE